MNTWKKRISAGVLSILAISGGLTPAQAFQMPRVGPMPIERPVAAQGTEGLVHNVQIYNRRDAAGNPQIFRERRIVRDRYRTGYRDGYWNGHRGYRYERPGYRYHRGYWFPLAAFAAGAVIGGAIAAPSRPSYGGSLSRSHVNWCSDRYRSYRASDNTFQPYNGPRQQCNSPY